MSEKNKKAKKAAEKAAAASTTQSKFSHSNPYDALAEVAPTPSVSNPAQTSAKASIQSPADDRLIPAWTNDFWKTYGNKLRVYGTVEEQCDLTARRKIVSSSPEKTDDEDAQGLDEESTETTTKRRGSVLASLQESLQSLWLGKK